MLQKEDYNHSFSFPKKEKLCSKKKIETLISNKTNCFCFPFKCYYRFAEISPLDKFNQIAIAVPKRLFKSAVDRNRIKRLIREAYRLTNKDSLAPFTTEKNKKVDLLILFVGKEIPTYELIRKKIILLFDLLNKK